MSYQHPSKEEIKNILQTTKRIAVIGISDKPDRASYQVSKYMQQTGYEIIPVNPRLTEVLGIKAYPTLEVIDGPVDLVNVFRRSEETVLYAEQALKIGAKVLWLQLGIRNEETWQKASESGIEVVMDRCIKVDHSMIVG